MKESVKILVGNLVSDVDVYAIRDLFNKADGTVTSVELPVDERNGKGRGYAIVHMATQVEAEEAIKMLDGSEIGGRRVSMSIAAAVGCAPKPAKKWYLFGF